MELANSHEGGAINESSGTIVNSAESVSNSSHVWHNHLGKLAQYVGNRQTACYIKFTPSHLQTSSKMSTLVLLEMTRVVTPHLPST